MLCARDELPSQRALQMGTDVVKQSKRCEQCMSGRGVDSVGVGGDGDTVDDDISVQGVGIIEALFPDA